MNYQQQLFRKFSLSVKEAFLMIPESLGPVSFSISHGEFYKLLGKIQMEEKTYKLWLIERDPKLAQILRLDKKIIEEEIRLEKARLEWKHLLKNELKNNLQSVVDFYLNETCCNRLSCFIFKDEYNDFLWGHPSKKALQIIYTAAIKHFETHPTGRLIDIGCGSGAFLMLLEQMGIPSEKLVGLDFKETMCSPSIEFFPITRITKRLSLIQTEEKEEKEETEEKEEKEETEERQEKEEKEEKEESEEREELMSHINSEDCILIVWGYNVSDVIPKCIEKGISTIIIQGEPVDGCTTPNDMLERQQGWTYSTTKVPAPYYIKEYVSVSTK
ncbi:MAG: class I SAM-dependent methyltransferase [Candidatus Paceibacterota bacterium]